MWWMPLVEFFGRIALKYGLKFLENRYPGIAPILDRVIKWIEGQAAVGNTSAVQVLSEHVDTLCSGAGCPPTLKHD